MNPTQPSSADATRPVRDAAAPATLDLKVTASPNFAQLLLRNGLSLVVSTYDAGKLIILRASKAGLNVHFVGFARSMGIAVSNQLLAVGTAHAIEEFRNVPAVSPRLTEDTGTEHDACFIPRHRYTTGHIDVHEMAWAGDKLWFINTLFSCLCTLDPAYSFAPRWRPPFVKGLSPDDRCHLNGLAMVDNRPTYVTALGVSDEPTGWRANKHAGGIVMDIASAQIVAQGLSMPHSPRVYANNLWVLESGRGSFARVDRQTGKVETIAELSGFTRGLDFHGDLAFVGLSRVRESNVFGGLALTERLPEAERFVGIQVLNLANGNVEGFLRFDSGVHEIFAVQIVPGFRYPTVLEDDDPIVATAYTLSDEALAQIRPT